MSHKPSNPAAEPSGTPSDLELMLYADGELPEERLAEVEAYLERTASGRAKVRALDFTSALIREEALASAARAGDLTDAIFARIQAEAPPVVEAAPVKLATVHALPVAKRVPGLQQKKPANDGSRAIFTLAAVAFAAAAGLMLWGKMRIAPDPQAHLRPMPVQTAVVARTELPVPAKSAEIAAEGDDDHGVEVATVNFGSRSGSIFYVPKGVAASNATTTVVWLNDDAAGGE
jgi:anti-sigma factor RsiW